MLFEIPYVNHDVPCMVLKIQNRPLVREFTADRDNECTFRLRKTTGITTREQGSWVFCT